MKKPIIVFGIVLGLSLCSGYGWPSAALRLSLDQLTQEADRVSVTRVVSVGKSFWGPKHMRIYTEYTFETEQDLAGRGAKHFSIVQPGGKVGRWAQKTDGFPSFKKNDRLMLFLRKHQAGYRVVGLSQGVFGFHLDGNREIIFQKLEGLSFPGNHGRPMLFDRQDLEEQIKSSWGQRKAR